MNTSEAVIYSIIFLLTYFTIVIITKAKQYSENLETMPDPESIKVKKTDWVFIAFTIIVMIVALVGFLIKEKRLLVSGVSVLAIIWFSQRLLLNKKGKE